MARKDKSAYPNQKLKMVYLYKIFYELTDENHPLSISELSNLLNEYGISAERKALYEDIEALCNFGLDIITVKGRAYSYYLGSREFELPELKLLADAVCSSKFLTNKKSQSLLKKIESLASINEGKEIQRQVFIVNRVKSINERIYINVDTIHRAINEGKQIAFRYFDYDMDKQPVYRPGIRTASPYALTWDDEKYYLIAYYSKYPDTLTNFRVDRMSDISVTDDDIIRTTDKFDVSEYMNSTFSMFSGNNADVVLKFDNSLINAAIDRFGIDAMIAPYDENSFTLKTAVKATAPFFGWLFQFGEKVSIMKPESLKKQYLEQLENVIKSINGGTQ